MSRPGARHPGRTARAPAPISCDSRAAGGFSEGMKSLPRSLAVLALPVVLASTACGQADLPTQANVSLVADRPAALTVQRAKTGHLLVPARINGRDAGWFIFDTGAGMSCIARPVAAEWQLPAAGEATAAGTAGAQATTFRRADTFEFGPVRLERTLLAELDLAAISEALGVPIAGIIGYECFFAGVFEIDVTAPAIAVRPAADYRLPDNGRWHAFELIGRRPHLAAQVEQHAPATFLLDLGSNEGVTLYSPAVRQLALLEGRETTPTQHGGVGGMQPARRGRLQEFTLAGHTLTDVPTTFSQATAGTFASSAKAGAIGVRVLGQFHLVLDYAQHRLAFLPKG